MDVAISALELFIDKQAAVLAETNVMA